MVAWSVGCLGVYGLFDGWGDRDALLVVAERVEGRPCAELAPTSCLSGQCSVAYRSYEQVKPPSLVATSSHSVSFILTVVIVRYTGNNRPRYEDYVQPT